MVIDTLFGTSGATGEAAVTSKAVTACRRSPISFSKVPAFPSRCPVRRFLLGGSKTRLLRPRHLQKQSGIRLASVRRTDSLFSSGYIRETQVTPM